MILDEITLINFKNFSNITVSFHEGVNLFVGTNGSGKTSILEAINVAMGGFFASQESKMQRPIEFDEIKITKGLREQSASVMAKSTLIQGKWSRTINKDTKSNDVKFLKNVSAYGKTFFDDFNSDDQLVAPLIAYYSTQRLFKDSSLSEKQRYDAANGRRNGYLKTLKGEAIKGALNEWLGNAVTRRATLLIKEIDKTDLVLENVENAIRKTMLHFLDLPADFSLKIYPDPDFNNELYVYYDEDHDLPLSYYSDGFRNLLYLIFDMVWRASQLNPWLTLEQIAEQVTGVVTIDEIDLHLHPKWQGKAIELIQLLFPRVQFFITTHSPTVVANFNKGTLYLIANDKIETYNDSFFGKQINQILRDVLGAHDRHVPTQQKLDELYRAIDNNQEEKYTALLGELKELLGSDDTDINRAEAMIHWQKSLA